MVERDERIRSTRTQRCIAGTAARLGVVVAMAAPTAGLALPSSALASTGTVSIGATARVGSNGVASVRLSCRGISGAICKGTFKAKATYKTTTLEGTRTVTRTTTTTWSVKYSVGAGETVPIGLKLGKPLVKLVRSGRRVSISATATPATGRPITRTVTVVGTKTATT
jgi:hypothetical protein